MKRPFKSSWEKSKNFRNWNSDIVFVTTRVYCSFPLHVEWLNLLLKGKIHWHRWRKVCAFQRKNDVINRIYIMRSVSVKRLGCFLSMKGRQLKSADVTPCRYLACGPGCMPRAISWYLCTQESPMHSLFANIKDYQTNSVAYKENSCSENPTMNCYEHGLAPVRLKTIQNQYWVD